MNMIGATTDSGRFHFSREPKPRSVFDAWRCYAVSDGDETRGYVLTVFPKSWFWTTGPDAKRVGPFPTRLAAARALVETTEGT